MNFLMESHRAEVSTSRNKLTSLSASKDFVSVVGL